MDLSPRVAIVIDELLLDGVEPGDPLVMQAVERAVAGSLPRGSPLVSPRAVATSVGEALRTEASA